MAILISEEEVWSSSCVDTIPMLQLKAQARASDVSDVDEHASSSPSSSECTETVGCQTSVWFGDGNPSNDDQGEEEEEVERSLVFKRGNKKRGVTVSFPPPIPQHHSYLKSIRKDGRLVMQMVNRPKPTPRFHSVRQGGRLILHRITDNHQEQGNMCIESPKSTPTAENRAISSQTSAAASESESGSESSESESEEVFPVSPCYERKKRENVEDKCTDAWCLGQNVSHVEQSNVRSENRNPQELHQSFGEEGVRAYEKALAMEFVRDHNGLIRQGSIQKEEEYSVCVRTFWDTWRRNAVDSSCANTLRLNTDLPSSCFAAASF